MRNAFLGFPEITTRSMGAVELYLLNLTTWLLPHDDRLFVRFGSAPWGRRERRANDKAWQSAVGAV